MLQLYTNEKNPATLKLLIAAKYAEKEINVEIVKLDDKTIKYPGHLPYLIISDDHTIFSPNSAVWYLSPPIQKIQQSVNEWFEWESCLLAPNVALILSGNTKNDSKTDVLACLKRLDTTLTNATYIINNEPTVCDIVIWSTLYPLYIDNALNNEYLNEYSSVAKWLKLLSENNLFKNAVNDFNVVGSGNSFLIGSKYPISTSKNIGAENTKNTPTIQSEVVSEDELEAARQAWKKTVNDLPSLKQPETVVLPIAGERNVLITSALPYVNNVPHLGNIIGCVLSADVFARFSRIRNNNTLFVCGTDEYGTATETKALEEGLSCQAICDKYFQIHSDIYKWFNISFDHFGRTSTLQQTELCQQMFLRLNDNGFMFTQAVEQLHCEHCDRYLADRFVEGGCPNVGCNYEDARGDQCDGCGKLVNAIELKNPRCKICSNTPKLKTSNQFFIDLPKLEPLVLHWMKKAANGWSHNAQEICKAWLKEGLKPRCITRDLKWGVAVPLDGYRNKVFYVWFDAPIGYLSITKAYTDKWEEWWKPSNGVDVTLYQFMAKDNVPFHSVMFPATLLGANCGYTTVSHLMATEYLNYEDGKFSKSRGIGVFGNDARDTGIPSDVWRFYLLYIRPETQDSSFSWLDLATKNNSELLNNLGNFINRALVFAKNNFNKTVPEMELIDDDYILLALCTREFKDYVNCLEKGKQRDGIRHILAISKHGNQYMQANQPWVLLKADAIKKARAGTIIGVCCNLACLLAILLHPYMPDTSANLLKQLNLSKLIVVPNEIEIINILPAGHKLGEPSPLFNKIEPAKIEELKMKFAGKQVVNGVATVNDLASVEAEVKKQADKVRQLKSNGVEKKVWQPEVTILLELKKKLANLMNDKLETDEVKVDVKKLEEQVAKQASVVRKLKEGGADRSVWQPEVKILLDLKSKLLAASK